MTSTQFDVIVVGAGVVGPAIATALARQGRKVLIVERSWEKPDRIVGELMQPAGLKALRELGMIQAVNNIEATFVEGYYIKYNDDVVSLKYMEKSKAQVTNPTHPVPGCVKDGNDKLLSDGVVDATDWEMDSRVRGIAFHHGDFLMNLRSIVKSEPNVTALQGNVTQIIRDDEQVVNGVKAKLTNADGSTEIQTFSSKLVVCCDGIYSKFRKELSKDNIPHTGSHFVGLNLVDAKLPMPHRGHVILGDHAPAIIYQISPHDTRILCAYRSTTPPSQTSNEFQEYLYNEVLPSLPKETQPSFLQALKSKKFKVMPNQYLAAKKQGAQRGLIMLGDSLNMRHPLTGGGMTVGLNDVALLAKLLQPEKVPDLQDYDKIATQLKLFHSRRKNLDAVINTLSIALYSLFAADKNSLKILQKGCFKYFLRGGDCMSGPMGLLSGMLPFPMLLFNHFFSVAFYAIYCNFIDRGLLGFLVAFFEAFEVIFTAIYIFSPYLWKELV
ncbi:squalene monooxygenase [[Candida] railenensis]|uniref:Squalene monooxygenase n=1 Tax=[Candida] railenensis TaxID=45579 RepID=A0A9P0QNK3_9ASCO|nr:squalene monooxygenase [[Candida] railenensis]